jgi:hypothetical protein
MKKKVISGLLAILVLSSCESLPNTQSLTVFPIDPEWQVFTRPPVIESVPGPLGENNFVVSDELVKKTIQQTKYIEKVKSWKIKNSVP